MTQGRDSGGPAPQAYWEGTRAWSYTGTSACRYGLFRRKHQSLIFTGLHGPAPRGQPLAGISLIEPGQQQDADDPNNGAPPIIYYQKPFQG